MRYLYVNNYRGFSSTYIPILDVNFLVGENSTGKSSVLNLIQIISSSKFWLDLDFNNDEVELGVFGDIVSATSSNRKFFQIGVIDCDDQESFPTNHQHAFLMTFVEEKGLPVLKDYSFVHNDLQFRIVFGRTRVKYQISDVQPQENLGATLLATFKEWVNVPAGSSHGYRFFSEDSSITRMRRSLMFMSGALRHIATGSTKVKIGVSDIFDLPIPSFAKQLVWTAPVRTKPARIYWGRRAEFTPEGEHTPLLIKDLLSREKGASDFRAYVAEFGEESGLFEDIYIQNFGRSFTSPFELGVDINGKRLRISDVGYGVSQSLPIIVELFARRKPSWFALQQPEVHLHPKAQASLGGLFLDLAAKANHRFLIGTHSDYLIDRFRTRFRDSEHKLSCQVIFFERCKEGNHIYPIAILDDGNYSDEQPDSFREFFINEELQVLGL